MACCVFCGKMLRWWQVRKASAQWCMGKRGCVKADAKSGCANVGAKSGCEKWVRKVDA